MNLFTTRPQDSSSDANAQQFLMSQFLLGKAFITLAIVVSVNDDGSVVSVKPMVEGFTGGGDVIPNSIIHGVPVWRLQRGNSAVKMKPLPMDIGLIAICDRDITSVKKNKSPSLPGSNRSHSYSDAIYLGGVLNAEPSQYIDFKDDGIDVVSPLKVNVNGQSVSITAEDQVAINASAIILNGSVVQGMGNRGGTAEFTNGAITQADFTAGAISLKNHLTPGIQRGGSVSDAPIP